MLFHALLLTLALAAQDGDRTEDFEGAGSDSWERVASDTHPPYNTVERVHDPELAKSGNQFLHLRTLGGSTAVRRSSRDPWAVEGGRPYQASVWVRLSGTRRNIAALSLAWVNSSGDVLAEQRSEPIGRTEGWTLRTIDIPASPAGAVGVLPGLHFEGPDVRGLCDFDLLEVAPVQRLGLRPANRPMALFSTEEYPRFLLTPAGLPAGVHAITVTRTAPDGTVITRTATIDLPSARSATVDFPPGAPGIHRVKASVDGHEASGSLAALVTAPGQAPAPAPAYERSASRLHDSVEAALQGRILSPQAPLVLDSLFLDSEGTPSDSYFALRLADQVLAGAEPIPDPGLFPPGVRVAAFRKGASVQFALWTEKGDVELVLPMNEGSILSLAGGSVKPLRPGGRITVGRLPTFVLDVDPLLTELRLELSSVQLPLQLNPTRLTLRMLNRSRVESPRDLTLSLDGLPAGWRASSRRFRIAALAPDAVHEESLDLIVPATESERSVELKFALTFTIQGREMTIQTTRELALKSPIRIESTVSAAKVLTVRLLNTSDHAMTLSLRARVPGLAERLELIRDLPPGSRSKAFDYPAPESGSAEISVQEAGGDRAVARRLLPLK